MLVELGIATGFIIDSLGTRRGLSTWVYLAKDL